MSSAAAATAGPGPVPAAATTDWTPVCHADDLGADRGVRALQEGRAVAVFRCSFGDGLYAVDDLDPFSGASVLSRGLVGTTRDRSGTAIPFVASPMRKQRFDLRSGVSLDDPSIRIATWEVRESNGILELGRCHTPVGSPSIISGS